MLEEQLDNGRLVRVYEEDEAMRRAKLLEFELGM